MPIRWPPSTVRKTLPQFILVGVEGKTSLCNPSYRGYPSVRRDNLSPTPRSVLRPGSESTPDPLRPPEAARRSADGFPAGHRPADLCFQNFPYIRRKQAQKFPLLLFFLWRNNILLSSCPFHLHHLLSFIYEMAGQVMHDFMVLFFSCRFSRAPLPRRRLHILSPD